MTIPNRIHYGDTIGVISPCYAADPEILQKSVDEMKKQGFSVKIGKNVYHNTYGYAASPEERAEDFNAMIADDSVQMVLFDGGEVGNEILPLINFEQIKKHPKIICSYSDGTTLTNAVHSKTGLVTYNGQSVNTFGLLPTEYNIRSFQSRLMQNSPSVFERNSNWRIFGHGSCSGVLIGGYLINFAVMMNGSYFTYDKNEDYILFLEDHNAFSSASVVSKFLSHIEQSGFFDHVRGLIFGHYAEEGVAVEESKMIDGILSRIAAKYKIPVVRCEDFGHGKNNAILPIGIRANFDADSSTLEFCQDTVL